MLRAVCKRTRVFIRRWVIRQRLHHGGLATRAIDHRVLNTESLSSVIPCLLGGQRRRVPPMSPQPELGLHEDARADRGPRLGGVHDGEIEATKKLADAPTTESVSQPDSKSPKANLKLRKIPSKLGQNVKLFDRRGEKRREEKEREQEETHLNKNLIQLHHGHILPQALPLAVAKHEPDPGLHLFYLLCPFFPFCPTNLPTGGMKRINQPPLRHKLIRIAAPEGLVAHDAPQGEADLCARWEVGAFPFVSSLFSSF